jgi:hypothetical protein
MSLPVRDDILVLTYNICFGCMTNKPFANRTGSAIAKQCSGEDGNFCFNNLRKTLEKIKKGSNGRQFDFIGLQEASKFWFIAQFQVLNNMNYVHTHSGKEESVIFYNPSRFKLDAVQCGTISEPGRPYIILYLTKINTNNPFIVINLHNLHNSKKSGNDKQSLEQELLKNKNKGFIVKDIGTINNVELQKLEDISKIITRPNPNIILMGDTNDIGQNYWTGLNLFGSIVKATKKPPPTCCITSSSAVHTMSNDYILINDRLEYNNIGPIENLIPIREIVVPVSDHLPVVSVVKEISSYTPTPIMPVATMGVPPAPISFGHGPSAAAFSHSTKFPAASFPAASFVSSKPTATATLPTFSYTGPAVFAPSHAIIAPSFPTNSRKPAITPESHPLSFAKQAGRTQFNIKPKTRGSNKKPPRSVRFANTNPNPNSDPYHAQYYYSQSMIPPHSIPGPGTRTNFRNSRTSGKPTIDILAHSRFEQPSNPIPSGFEQPSNPIGLGNSPPIRRRQIIKFPKRESPLRKNLFSTSSPPHPRMPIQKHFNNLKEEESFFMNHPTPFNIESEEEEFEEASESELITNIKSISIYTKLFKLNKNKNEFLRLQNDLSDPIKNNKLYDSQFKGDLITKDSILYFPNGAPTDNNLVLVQGQNSSGYEFAGYLPQDSIISKGREITIDRPQTLRLQDSLQNPENHRVRYLPRILSPFKGGIINTNIKYADGVPTNTGLVVVQVLDNPNSFGYIEFSKLQLIKSEKE